VDIQSLLSIKKEVKKIFRFTRLQDADIFSDALAIPLSYPAKLRALQQSGLAAEVQERRP